MLAIQADSQDLVYTVEKFAVPYENDWHVK